MKNNSELQKDVMDAIKWEPLLHAAEIGVTVKDGIVTLTGTVDNYIKKSEAEDAAKNVAGVQAVVEKIEVKFGSDGKVTDGEIAKEVLNALKWNWQVPNDKVKVKVEDGWVTLEGELHWDYQRSAARAAVVNLLGVKGVSNGLKLKPELKDKIEQREIENALSRSWSINSEDIEVSVVGTKVILNGTVNSWYEKDEAAKIAWKAPGVWSVENDLVVEYDYSMVE
ncbi:MAG: BON domain-containing protein [Chryseolinea sp.]